MPRSAWLVATALAGAALLAPPALPAGVGMGRAEAAQGYHTRKKVNGRWVTGKFRDKGAAAAASAAPEPGATAPVAKALRRVRFTERQGLARTRYSSLPKMRTRVVLTTGPAGSAASTVPSPPRPIAEAPSAKTSASTDLPPDRVLSTASIHPAPVVVLPGAERMRAALEARARQMASGLGLVTIAPPEPAPAARLTARSVTYDLSSGTRTIVFDDGAAVTAPFDRARAETLNGLPGAR